MSQASDYVPPSRSQTSNLSIVVTLLVIGIAFVGLVGWLLFEFAQEARERARRNAANVGGMKNLAAAPALYEARQARLATQVDELLAKYDRPDSPDQQLTVICLSNSDEIVAWNINRRIAELFLADQLHPKPASAPTQAASDLPTATVDESHLRDKVGAYRMQRTGMIWQIAFQDGQLQLIDHLLKKNPLQPLNETRFDPEGPFYATTQFVFSRTSEDGPWTFTSQWEAPDDRSKLEFDRVELVQPTPDQLAEYAGTYVSDELAATYRLAIRDGQLWLRVNSRRWNNSTPRFATSLYLICASRPTAASSASFAPTAI